MALKLESPPPAAAPEVALEINKPGQQTPAKPPKDDKIDAPGVEEFLKQQLGADRYAEIGAKAKADGKVADKPEDKPAKPAEKPKEKAEPAKDDGKKPTVAKVKPGQKPFKPKATPEPALTQEQIAAAAAEGATRALTANKPKGEGAADKVKGPELSPEDKRITEILTRMEQLYPDKYKGMAEKYPASVAKLQEYAKEWEAVHPGEKFDEKSPEHEDFFNENDLDWTDEDYTEALADIRAEKRMQEATKKTDERLEELDRAEKLRQHASEIGREQTSAAQHYWSKLGDELADVIKPDGTLNIEKINALKSADQESLGIQVSAAEQLDAEVAEIWKLYNQLAKNDPANNPVHRAINNFAAEKEREWSARPTQNKLNAQGQAFVPAAAYYHMTKSERENHWTFNAADLAYMRAEAVAEVVRKQVESNEQRHVAWAKSRGIQIEKPDAKPESPSAGGESRVAAVAGGTGKTATDVGNVFMREQLGSR